MEGPPPYAVAYELASLVLQNRLFDSFDALAEYAHREPRGCVNDLCEHKPHVAMKLRTADLCSECMQLIRKRKIDPALVSQVLTILDRVRSQFLFRERYPVTLQPSRMEIRDRNLRIFFTDLADEELLLPPVYKAVYLLFLSHPEGIAFKEMPDYQEELERIYQKVYTGGSVASLKKTVQTLAWNEDSKLSEVISKIKSKLVNQLGEEMAAHYIIQGEKGERRRIAVGSA